MIFEADFPFWLLQFSGAWFLHTWYKMEQQKDALRSLILNCFSGILSGDQNQIRDAEEDMKALEIKEGPNPIRTE